MILAIDPGPEKTAWVQYENGRVIDKRIDDNVVALAQVAIERCMGGDMVIEMVASYGMPVGAEVFETVYWIGRFAQCWDSRAKNRSCRLFRRDVKMHLCGNNAAKDANVRAALLDKFGPGKEKAVGTKKAPGPLYGIKADEWAALALAVTFAETRAT